MDALAQKKITEATQLILEAEKRYQEEKKLRLIENNHKFFYQV